MKFCPRCGQQLDDNAMFCVRCGVACNENVQNPSATSPIQNPIFNNPNAPIYEPQNAENPNQQQTNPSPNYAPQNASEQYSYQGTYYGDPTNPYMNQAPYMGNQPVHDNTLFEAYKLAFKNYANFEGRTRRRDYWFFVLVNSIVGMVFGMIMAISAAFSGFSDSEGAGFAWVILSGVVVSIYSIVVFIPSLSILVRRLHDTGKSGGYVFLEFIPYVGSIILLVFCCMDSQVGANQYGENPKGIYGQF